MNHRITQITLAGALAVNLFLGMTLYSFYGDERRKTSGGSSPAPAISRSPSPSSVSEMGVAGFPVEWQETVRMIQKKREDLRASSPAHFWDIPPSSKRWVRLGLPPGTFDEKKQFMVEEIEADYAELTRDLKNAFRGVLLPTDAEQLRYLESEKRKDLSALLSPDEILTYDCWVSDFACGLRSRLVNFQPDEAEFRTLVRLQIEFLKDIETMFPNDHNLRRTSALASVETNKRQSVERECEAAIREALGEERYQAYDRALTIGYGTLISLVKKQQLSQAAADGVFSLRQQINDECKRIGSDTTYTAEGKKERLKVLADEITDRARKIAGADFIHVQAQVQGWTEPLREGSFLRLSRNGYVGSVSPMAD